MVSQSVLEIGGLSTRSIFDIKIWNLRSEWGGVSETTAPPLKNVLEELNRYAEKNHPMHK